MPSKHRPWERNVEGDIATSVVLVVKYIFVSANHTTFHKHHSANTPSFPHLALTQATARGKTAEKKRNSGNDTRRKKKARKRENEILIRRKRNRDKGEERKLVMNRKIILSIDNYISSNKRNDMALLIIVKVVVIRAPLYLH